jgi:hypothetical protein
MFSPDAENNAKPFILASTGDRNNISSSGNDLEFLARNKEGMRFHYMIS